MSKLLLNADSATANQMVLSLLTKYLDVEDKFKGKAMDAAILSLIAANKDNMRAVINAVMARLALKTRNQLALSLTRNLLSFLDRFPGYVVTPEIEKVLERLAALPGTEYGEVSLVASSVYSDFKVPDYQSRLSELRDFIMSDTPQAISTSRKLSLSVDSLSELFNDADPKVREAAREVYVRRVYRAHNFIEVKQTEVNGVATIHWKFQLRDSPPQVLAASLSSVCFLVLACCVSPADAWEARLDFRVVIFVGCPGALWNARGLHDDQRRGVEPQPSAGGVQEDHVSTGVLHRARQHVPRGFGHFGALR